MYDTIDGLKAGILKDMPCIYSNTTIQLHNLKSHLPYKFTCKCGNKWHDTGDGFCDECGKYTTNAVMVR
jgi:hypothetical protein